MKTLLATPALCLQISLALGFCAEGPTEFSTLPNELLYTIEYLTYEDWLAIYGYLGENGYRIPGVVVFKITILPTHAGKPIPFTVISARD